MTVFELYNYSKSFLKKYGITSYDEDSSYLISSLLSIPKSEIFLNKERKINLNELLKVYIALRKRCKNIPIAYILGYQYFYEDRFIVDKKTFIPKYDTEHIIYEVKNLGLQFKNILDICTGSGILALTLAKTFPHSKVIGIDKYIKIAKKNSKLLNIKNVEFLKVDFLKIKNKFEDKFDLIVSNPPYLSKDDLKLLSYECKKYEPKRAFLGGEDGLIFYRKIKDFSLSFLNQNGYILLEVDHKWQNVLNIFIQGGFKHYKIIKDYNQLERVLILRKE
ncbi:MAG: peptide chain release factor N(5)-glutamine methyltransferase [Brevinematales bacterium]|nr:peptide chain release factor N(5)-glutamine methyltransferase [Brevinematales bacterium]